MGFVLHILNSAQIVSCLLRSFSGCDFLYMQKPQSLCICSTTLCLLFTVSLLHPLKPQSWFEFEFMASVNSDFQVSLLSFLRNWNEQPLRGNHYFSCVIQAKNQVFLFKTALKIFIVFRVGNMSCTLTFILWSDLCFYFYAMLLVFPFQWMTFPSLASSLPFSLQK